MALPKPIHDKLSAVFDTEWEAIPLGELEEDALRVKAKQFSGSCVGETLVVSGK